MSSVVLRVYDLRYVRPTTRCDDDATTTMTMTREASTRFHDTKLTNTMMIA